MNKANSILTDTKSFFAEIGDMTLFAGRFFKEASSPPFEFKELLRQCYQYGQSLLAFGWCNRVYFRACIYTSVAAHFDAVWRTILDGHLWLVISIVREIGPVIIALICAGRIGSGIGAELGSMRVTEQIDAMEVSGTNPFKYLVVTRIVATTLMLPLLIIMGDAIALFGSALIENLKGDVSYLLYFNQVFDALKFQRYNSSNDKIFFLWLCYWIGRML